MTIITEFVYPPIPIRSFDWAAMEEGYDLGSKVGRGETQEEAVLDLLEQLEEQ